MSNAVLVTLYRANQRLLWKQSIKEHQLGLHTVFAGCLGGLLHLSLVCLILPGQLQIFQNILNMLSNGNMTQNSENNVNVR